MNVGIALTEAQHAALERFGESSRVIGVWEDTPVLRDEEGSLVRVSPLGRVLQSTPAMVEDLRHRLIDWVFPRLSVSG